MNVRISRLAEVDLAHIYGHIASHDSDAAERFRIEAEKAIRLLAGHPELGPRPSWKTRHKRLRFCVISRFNNFLIYYEPHKDGIAIARVLDGRRDVRRIIEKGQEEPAEE